MSENAGKMISYWFLTFETTDLRKAEKLFHRLLEKIGRPGVSSESTSSHSTPGIRFIATIELNSSSWRDAVFELIELAQSVGHGWVIQGSVNDDFSLLASDGISISGIKMIECGIRLTEQTNC
jgi:hypothetical protein